jgi:DnaK suppressor protein
MAHHRQFLDTSLTAKGFFRYIEETFWKSGKGCELRRLPHYCRIFLDTRGKIVNEMRRNNKMEADELLAIRNELLLRKKELEGKMAELYTQQEDFDQVQDSADQAQSSTMEALKISLQTAELDEYNRILQALAMLDEGSYGICVECSQPIAPKRLKLFPNAMRCLACQELAEERSGEG